MNVIANELVGHRKSWSVERFVSITFRRRQMSVEIIGEAETPGATRERIDAERELAIKRSAPWEYAERRESDIGNAPVG